MTVPDQPAPASPARAVLTYNLLRLLLLVGCLLIGWLIGLPGLWLIVVSLLVSGVASYFLLTKQRVAMGVALEQSVARGRQRLAERTAAEDAYADALAARSEPPTPVSDDRGASGSR